MKQIIAHAPAKINLVLEVEPLEAGEEKHQVSSVFCTTTLADTLLFDFVSGKEPFNAQVAIEGIDVDTSFINKHDNTLTKTVEHFKRTYGFEILPSGTLSVQLFKSIPMQAGLGGGSTDAAAMLRMLCWIAKVEPLSESSLSVARAVGADVPFFLYAPKGGLCAHMRGFGDEFVEALPKPGLHLTLVKPARGVSTKNAYATFDSLRDQKADAVALSPSTTSTSAAALSPSTTSTPAAAPPPPTTSTPAAARSRGAVENLATALRAQKGLEEIAALCTNNLESAATDLLPEIAALKKELRAFPGVLSATLCGSGSALFAICPDDETSHACMEHFSKKGIWSVAIKT